MYRYILIFAIVTFVNSVIAQNCSSEVLRKQVADASITYSKSQKITLMSLFADGEQKGFKELLQGTCQQMILSSGTWLFTIIECPTNKGAAIITISNDKSDSVIKSKLGAPTFYTYAMEANGLVEFKVTYESNQQNAGMMLVQKIIE